MKNLLLSIFLVGGALSLQSCLHDDNELFGTPAAQRVQETAAAHKKLLESAPNGWEMHYYAGSEYSGGGYTMLIKFENGKARVMSDLASSTKSSTSSYDVIKDMGPVLTFNTYNELMHYLAQPYQTNVEGEQGDYEFLILDATPERISLKGKKWKNLAEMTPIPVGINWATYIDDLRAISDKLAFVYDDKVDGQTVSNLYLDKDSRRASLIGENQPESAYYVTTKGIHLQSPIPMGGGVTVSDLELDPATGNLVAPGQTSLQVTKDPNENKNLDITKLYGTWDADCEVIIGSKSGGGQPTPKKVQIKFKEIKNELGDPYKSIVQGTIINGKDEYNFYLYYRADEGVLRLGLNYVADPTGEHPYLEIYPWSDSGSVKFTYDSANDQILNTDPDTGIAYTYSDLDENGEEGLYLAIAFDKLSKLTNHVKN